jgi:hypothetical protein
MRVVYIIVRDNGGALVTVAIFNETSTFCYQDYRKNYNKSHYESALFAL